MTVDEVHEAKTRIDAELSAMGVGGGMDAKKERDEM